jgi:predicted RNA-binding protein YlqC (UPF0109 family)
MTEVERVENALQHLLHPLLQHKDDLTLNIIEKTSVVIVELSLHSEDASYLNEGEDSLLQALKRLMSVAGKERKLSLNLIEDSAE